MAVSQESVVIGDFGAAMATERIRTTGAGIKSRITLDWKCQPVIANVDPRSLGRPMAAAIEKAIKESIAGITAQADPATQLRRKYAEAALAGGKGWAVKRYSGGKTGTKPPNAKAGGRLFNDSGRFVEGLTMRATKDGGEPDGQATWTANVPVNRLNPSTFTAAQFEQMLEQLANLCPEMRDPAKLFDQPGVAAALKTCAAGMVEKTNAAEARLRAALKGTVQAGQELGEAVGEFGEEG